MSSRMPWGFALALGACACSSSGSPTTPSDAGSERSADGPPGADAEDAHADGRRARDAGVPYLTELRVSGGAADAEAPIALVPPFSSKVFDYYVRCGAGTNRLSVEMTASPGANALVLLPSPSGLAPRQTVTVSVGESAAIVAAATDGTSTEEYWVRCLPHDFPRMKMTPHADAGAPTPGYYLLGSFLPAPGDGAFAMILDGRGVPVWYGRQNPGETVCDVDQVLPGTVSYSSEAPLGGTSVSPFVIRAFSPPSTSFVTVGGSPTDGHELRVLHNGHFLVFWAGLQTGVDMTGVTLPLSDGGTQAFGPNSNISACDILELDSSGQLVWAWTATDHFDPAKDLTYFALPLVGPGGVPVVDAFHCNSLDIDDSGNLLVSARHMDTVFYVEKATGRVLWKMGGVPANKDGARFVPVDQPFFRQHDARILKGWSSPCGTGEGAISVFDDQTGQLGPSRAAVYDVRIDGPDAGDAARCPSPGDAGGAGDSGAAGTTRATLVWEYSAAGPTTAMGSFRILPDGSRVIGWGSSRATAFTEVDEAKHDMLDFSFTDGTTSYRAIKVPEGAFDVHALRVAAGQ